MGERVAKTSVRSFAEASAVCDHRLSRSGRSLRRPRPRDEAIARSYWREGIRYRSVGAAGQPRSEADRAYARNSLGSGVGSALAAGDGDVGWVRLEWPDL